MRETLMNVCPVLASMEPSVRISQGDSTVCAKLDTQEKCVNLQSITVNAIPASMVVPVRAVWSHITATVRSVSLASTVN